MRRLMLNPPLAISAVTVVPMLAPSISGKTSSRVMTPAAHRGTISEVVMLEDWTAIVIRTPTDIPMRPLLASAALSDRSIRAAISTFMFLVM